MSKRKDRLAGRIFTCAFIKWSVYVAIIWSHVHCVDRHRFDADPDSTFHFGADPHPDSEPDPTPGFTHVIMLGNQTFLKLLFIGVGVYLFFLYHQCHRCNNFHYVGQYGILKFSGKNIIWPYTCLPILQHCTQVTVELLSGNKPNVKVTVESVKPTGTCTSILLDPQYIPIGSLKVYGTV
jgi:hypothetical protein